MDSYFNVDTIARLLTFGIFALLGFDLSRSIPRPRNVYSWIATIVSLGLAALFGSRVPSVEIFGFEVFLDMVLLGACLGFISGFIVRSFPNIRLRKF